MKKAVFILFVCAVAVGPHYQQTAIKARTSDSAQTESLIEVGKYRLNVRVTAGHSPTILLESGGSLDATQWDDLHGRLAATTGRAVVSYDRAGFGKSGLPQSPYDVTQETEAIHKALTQLGLDEQVILVGHSYGGLLIHLYASQYNSSVKGLVFVDPNTASFVDAMGGPEQLLKHPLQQLPFDPENPSSKFESALARMIKGFPSTVEKLRQAPLPKGIPTIVITAGKPWWPEASENKAFRESHESLASAVDNGRLIIADRSSHNIPLERPDIILASVEEILQMDTASDRVDARSESSVELKIAPADCVYVQHDMYNSFTQRPYYDLMLHTLAVVNTTVKPVHIDTVKIEAFKDDQLIQCHVLRKFEILRVSKPLLEEMGGELRTLLDLILWTDKVVPQDFELTSDLNIKPKSALVIFNTFLSFSLLPDELRISAKGNMANGESLMAKRSLAVSQYQNRVKYRLPLEGSWLMRGMPANGILDHHRFGIPNEFGVDFCRVGPNGEAFQNEGKVASDYYGFGEKVLAAADGIVAAVNNSAVQRWTRFNPAEGESPEEFRARFFREMMEGFKGYTSGWVGGNYVIIKHAEKEYSSYFHLKEKSVRVKVGEKVRRGQHIGDVGNTGDSFEVHLHFQVNDSADFANGRSLPFTFENMETVFREPGRFVWSRE